MKPKEQSPRPAIQSVLVTAEQMQQIEGRIFEAGMPVAALMEKVSKRIALWFVTHYGPSQGEIGVLAGPGHNGGDALVVARELHHAGYGVKIYQPFSKLKELTEKHAKYAKHLNIPFAETVEELADCSAIIDGFFGFGLTRPIADSLSEDVERINRLPARVFSIDLPSGIHTDTGQAMGKAIAATHTACLGLWKRGFMQENAIAHLGKCSLIDFDIPLADINAVLGESSAVQRLTDEQAIAHLPLHRSPTAHKYKAGHLLLIAGSKQYAGAALLTGLGAIASGVGMLTLAVPESIRLSLLPELPAALLVGCPETEFGAIARLPDDIDLERYDAIALGPGLTQSAPDLLQTVLAANCPLLLDADGLNLLAKADPIQTLRDRSNPTVLTPHFGEFKRLFPEIANSDNKLPGEIAREAAEASSAVVLLKGPRSAVATAQKLWFNPHSTPALARGGSGDVLTGLMGGLLAAQVKATGSSGAQTPSALVPAVLSAVWWHSQAAIYASGQRTLLGVDALHLARSLNLALQAKLSKIELED